jgi:flavin reductase (DIM6/NTAB) family NADH-FMN oxidoreductase RutF
MSTDNPGADAFQAIAADLEYPMAIVTTAVADERAGCLVGFVAQCSIDPPLVMVWLSKKNRTTRVAATADRLLVHFPGRDQYRLAALFGSQTGDEVDKFARCDWEPTADGLPRLTGCTRWVAGRIVERVDTGDHVGHLLQLADGAAGDWAGQLGFQSVKDLEPGHDA